MIIYFTIQAHFSLDVVTPCTLVRPRKDRVRLPYYAYVMYVCYRVIYAYVSPVYLTQYLY